MQELVIGNYAPKCKHVGGGELPQASLIKHKSPSIQANITARDYHSYVLVCWELLDIPVIKNLVGEAVSLP